MSIGHTALHGHPIHFFLIVPIPSTQVVRWKGSRCVPWDFGWRINTLSPNPAHKPTSTWRNSVLLSPYIDPYACHWIDRAYNFNWKLYRTRKLLRFVYNIYYISVIPFLILYFFHNSQSNSTALMCAPVPCTFDVYKLAAIAAASIKQHSFQLLLPVNISDYSPI